MIRCVYCDRLEVKKIQHKTFYYCRDYPDRLRVKLGALHPNWCKKAKEARQCTDTITTCRSRC